MTAKKISGRDACIATIRAAGTPLSANAISSAVVGSGVVPTLAGKTPKATLAAQITSGAKAGRVFRQVGESKPKVYELADGAPESDEQLVATMRAYLEQNPPGTPAPAAESTPAPAKVKTTAKPKTAGVKAQAKPDPKPAGTARQRRGRGAKESTAAA